MIVIIVTTILIVVMIIIIILFCCVFAFFVFLHVAPSIRICIIPLCCILLQFVVLSLGTCFLALLHKSTCAQQICVVDGELPYIPHVLARATRGMQT